MIEIFGTLASRANRVVWVLEELEVPYTFWELDFSKGDHRHPRFLDLNPAGKIPVLRDGSLVLTESAAIANYLGEKYPEKELIPPSGTPLRAKYDQWMFFVLAELEQPLWTMGKHKFAIPAEYRIPAVLPTALWEFAQASELLKKGLEKGPFILGERFSLADIFIAHTLIWAKMFKVPVEDPILNDYLGRMKARPAFAHVKDIPRQPFLPT